MSNNSGNINVNFECDYIAPNNPINLNMPDTQCLVSAELSSLIYSSELLDADLTTYKNDIDLQFECDYDAPVGEVIFTMPDGICDTEVSFDFFAGETFIFFQEGDDIGEEFEFNLFTGELIDVNLLVLNTLKLGSAIAYVGENSNFDLLTIDPIHFSFNSYEGKFFEADLETSWLLDYTTGELFEGDIARFFEFEIDNYSSEAFFVSQAYPPFYPNLSDISIINYNDSQVNYLSNCFSIYGTKYNSYWKNVFAIDIPSHLDFRKRKKFRISFKYKRIAYYSYHRFQIGFFANNDYSNVEFFNNNFNTTSNANNSLFLSIPFYGGGSGFWSWWAFDKDGNKKGTNNFYANQITDEYLTGEYPLAIEIESDNDSTRIKFYDAATNTLLYQISDSTLKNFWDNERNQNSFVALLFSGSGNTDGNPDNCHNLCNLCFSAEEEYIVFDYPVILSQANAYEGEYTNASLALFSQFYPKELATGELSEIDLDTLIKIEVDNYSGERLYIYKDEDLVIIPNQDVSLINTSNTYTLTNSCITFGSRTADNGGVNAYFYIPEQYRLRDQDTLSFKFKRTKASSWYNRGSVDNYSSNTGFVICLYPNTKPSDIKWISGSWNYARPVYQPIYQPSHTFNPNSLFLLLKLGNNEAIEVTYGNSAGVGAYYNGLIVYSNFTTAETNGTDFIYFDITTNSNDTTVSVYGADGTTLRQQKIFTNLTNIWDNNRSNPNDIFMIHYHNYQNDRPEKLCDITLLSKSEEITILPFIFIDGNGYTGELSKADLDTLIKIEANNYTGQLFKLVDGFDLVGWIDNYSGELSKIDIDFLIKIEVYNYSGELSEINLATIIQIEFNIYTGELSEFEFYDNPLDTLFDVYAAETFSIIDGFDLVGLIDNYSDELSEINLDTLIKIEADTYTGELSKADLDTLIKIEVDNYTGELSEFEFDYNPLDALFDAYVGELSEFNLDTLIKIKADGYTGELSEFNLDTLIKIKADGYTGELSEFEFDNNPLDTLFDVYAAETFSIIDGFDLIGLIDYYVDELSEINLDTLIKIEADNYTGELSEFNLYTLIKIEADIYAGELSKFEFDDNPLNAFFDGYTDELSEIDLDTLIKIEVDNYSGELNKIDLDTLIKIEVDNYSGELSEFEFDNNPLDTLFDVYVDETFSIIDGFDLVGLIDNYSGELSEINLDTLIKIEADTYAGELSKADLDTLIKIEADTYTGELYQFEFDDNPLDAFFDAYVGELNEFDLDTLIKIEADTYAGELSEFNLDTLIKIEADSYTGELSEIDLSTIIQIEFNAYAGELSEIEFDDNPLDAFFDGYTDELSEIDLDTLIKIEADGYTGELSEIEFNNNPLDAFFDGYTSETFSIIDGFDLVGWLDNYSGELSKADLDTLIKIEVDNYTGELSEFDLNTLIKIEADGYSGELSEFEFDNNPLDTLFDVYAAETFSIIDGFDLIGLIDYYVDELSEINLDTLIKIEADNYTGELSEINLDTLIKIEADAYAGELNEFEFYDNPLNVLFDGYTDELSEIDLDTLIKIEADGYTGELSEFNLDTLIKIKADGYTGELSEFEFSQNIIDISFDYYSGELSEIDLDTLIKIKADSYTGELSKADLATLIKIEADAYAGELNEFEFDESNPFEYPFDAYNGQIFNIIDGFDLIGLIDYYVDELSEFDLDTLIKIEADGYTGQLFESYISEIIEIEIDFDIGELFIFDLNPAAKEELFITFFEGQLLSYELATEDSLNIRAFSGQYLNNIYFATIQTLGIPRSYHGSYLDFDFSILPFAQLNAIAYTGDYAHLYYLSIPKVIPIGPFYAGQNFIPETIDFDIFYDLYAGENAETLLSTIDLVSLNEINNGEELNIELEENNGEEFEFDFYDGSDANTHIGALRGILLYANARNGARFQVDFDSSTDFDLSSDECCGERSKSTNLIFEMNNGRHPAEVSYGNRILVSVDLLTIAGIKFKPINTGGVFSLVDNSIFLEPNVFSDGTYSIATTEADFVHKLCKGYFIPTGDWVVIEFNDILSEDCYTDRIYSGEFALCSLSDDCVLRIPNINNGTRLEFFLAVQDLWGFIFYAGETLHWDVFEVKQFQAGELLQFIFYEAPIIAEAGESLAFDIQIKNFVMFDEDGCFENEFVYQDEDGFLIPEFSETAAVEGEPFRHDVKAHCY